jgi:predicted metal-dependent HD superfamily phosphohydrolase
VISSDDRSAELLVRWTGLVGGSLAAAEAGRALLDRWSESHRRYHDLAHLAAVVGRLDELAERSAADGSAGVPPAALRAATLAAFFHDAVYDPAGPDNEAASAALAVEVLGVLRLPASAVAEVARLVGLTRSHDPAPDDVAGALLCDADLGVLAGDPDAYAAYATAVRAEYATYPDEVFAAGRAQVLEALLARPSLFTTAVARAWWEAAARHNLETELMLLRAGLDHPSTDARGDAGGRPPAVG